MIAVSSLTKTGIDKIAPKLVRTRPVRMPDSVAHGYYAQKNTCSTYAP